MYTCIAYLIEIRKFCSKNLVYKGVNFEAQNALNSPTSTFDFKKKISLADPHEKGEGRGKGKGRRWRGQGWGGPPIHISGYATENN